MTHAGVFSFHLEDLSPRWLPPAQRFGATLAIAGLTAIIYGSIVGILIGLHYSLVYGLRFGLATAFGLGWFAWQDRMDPVDIITISREQVWFGAIFGLLSGLSGEVVDFNATARIGHLNVFLSALILGLAMGLLSGTAPAIDRRTTVNSGLKNSAIYAVLPLLLMILFALHRLVTSFWVSDIPTAGAVPQTLCVLLSASIGGTFCIQNLTMRYILARRKYIPWRYEAFLQFSIQRVLMIRQGGSFRFIHRMLQEHLASHRP